MTGFGLLSVTIIRGLAMYQRDAPIKRVLQYVASALTPKNQGSTLTEPYSNVLTVSLMTSHERHGIIRLQVWTALL